MSRFPPWPEVWASIRKLRPAILEGCDLEPNEDGWLAVHCLGHQDDTPSLRVNVREGGVKCMASCSAMNGTSNLNDLENFILDHTEMVARTRRPKDVVGDLAERRMLPRDWLIEVFGVEPAGAGYRIPVDDPEVDPEIEIGYEIDGLEKRSRHWIMKRGEWLDKKVTQRPKFRWEPKLKDSGVKAQDLAYNVSRIAGRLHAKERLVYIVAGAPDVWVMHRAGLPAVSFMAGENFGVPTPRAIDKLLKIGMKEAIVIYDVDEAGEEGAEKLALELNEEGVTTYVLELPEELGKGGDVTDLWRLCEGDADRFVDELTRCPSRLWQAAPMMDKENRAVERRRAAKVVHRLPEECWIEPFTTYRNALATATSACGEYHFFALMNILGAIFGRRAYVEYGRKMYPNQYTVLIGPSHSLKSTANNYAIEMVNTLYGRGGDEEPGAAALRGPRLTIEQATGSAEGLLEAAAFADSEPDEADAIRGMMGWKKVRKDEDDPHTELYDESDLEKKRERRLLIRQDEIASMLAKARQGGGGSGFLPHLMTGFDCPKEIRLRTRAKPVILLNVVPSILADSTVEYLGRYFDELEWASGFGNRICFVDGPPIEVMPKPPGKDEALWEQAVDMIREAFFEVEAKNGPPDHKNTPYKRGVEFVFTLKAEELWDRLYREWMTAREQGCSPEQLAATERVPDYAVKFSLLYALMRCDEENEIGSADVDLGWKVALYAEQVTHRLVGDLIDEKLARWQEQIKQYIDAHEPVKRRVLQQHFRRIPAPTLHQLLKTLEELKVVRGLGDGYHMVS